MSPRPTKRPERPPDLAPQLGRRLFVALTALAPLTSALGRTPRGGAVRLDLPFSLSTLDPHSPWDPASALLAGAAFDPLFARDRSGRPYPALAATLPEPHADGALVRLRDGLVSARGHTIASVDVVWSLARARRGAARPLFAGLGKARAEGALGVVVPGASPEAVAEALSSPATAILSRRSSPAAPDGTGAFLATPSSARLLLERNPRAARGASFLDHIEVRHANDLSSSLRSFEAAETEVGFLGAGLHGRRAGAVDLTTPPVGFVVLRTGPLAGRWGAPGIAAGLVGSLDPSRFERLGLEPEGASPRGEGWGGPPAELLVDGDSAYLVEVARVSADALSHPGHEVRVRPVPGRELRTAIEGGAYALALDFIRRIGPELRHAALSLVTAADPRLGDRPPRVLPRSLVEVARTLPLAVLGELALRGARSADVRGLETLDFGSVYRLRA